MKKIAAWTLSLGAALALSGCSPFDLLGSRTEVRFPDASAFSDSADPALESSPVPDDATTIVAAYHSDESENMIAFTSATGPVDCALGKLTGKPAFESTWWPSTEPAEGMVCGVWQVFAVDTRWYGWTN